MTKKRPTPKARAPTPRKRKPRARVGNVEKTVENTVTGPAVEAGGMRQGANGGQLQTGNPGNKGGSGRPSNLARELSMAGYLENLPRLIRIAAGTETRTALDSEGREVQVQPTLKESIDAMKEMGNRAIGSKVEVEAPSSPLAVTFTVGPLVAAERANAANRPG